MKSLRSTYLALISISKQTDLPIILGYVGVIYICSTEGHQSVTKGNKVFLMFIPSTEELKMNSG